MEPPDPWASYLRQRGGGQASDNARGSNAGRPEILQGLASLQVRRFKATDFAELESVFVTWSRAWTWSELSKGFLSGGDFMDSKAVGSFGASTRGKFVCSHGISVSGFRGYYDNTEPYGDDAWCSKRCSSSGIARAKIDSDLARAAGNVEVISMLRPLDRPELIAQAANAELGATAAKHYPVLGVDQNFDGGGSAEDNQDEDDGFLYDEADEEETLEEDESLFEDREFDEDEAMYIKAYHSAYSDVRRDLQNRRKERGFIRHRGRSESKGRPKGKGRGRSSGAPRQQPSRYNKMVRGSADDLLSRTRCYNCKELGHYARDCPLKGSGKGNARPASSGTPKQVSFVVCRGNVDQTVQHNFVQTQVAWPLMYAGVAVKPADALVDTAAEDAVVGDRAFAKMTSELAQHQLRPLWLREGQGPTPCAGIGGAASTVGQADVPTCVAGTLGVIRFTILKDTDAFQTPPLLPISYLEAVDAVIDLPRGQLLTASGRSVAMERLPSGHRSVPILDFHSTPWQLPVQLQVNGSDPFALTASDALQFSGVVEVEDYETDGISGIFGVHNFPVSSSSASGVPRTKKEQANDSGLLARELLEKEIYDYPSVEELVSRLPVGKPSAMRGLLRQTEAKSGVVTFGLYAHGAMKGITTSSNEMPTVCQYLNKWVATVVPESFRWTSLSVGVQTSALPHVDAHNEASSHNMSVTVGQFSKGELWLQAEPKDLVERRGKIVWREKGGRKIPGYLANTYRNPVFFSPKQCHATMSWLKSQVPKAVAFMTSRSPLMAVEHDLTGQPECSSECSHEQQFGLQIRRAESPPAMASLQAQAQKMVALQAADLEDHRRLGSKRSLATWRRLVVALMTMLATARNQMVVDYLMNREEPEEIPQETTPNPQQPKTKKKAVKGPLAQGIGAPLKKSEAHKNFPMKISECNHPPDALRCRGNQTMKWWVCTRCGSRWSRPEEKELENEEHQKVVTTEDAPKLRDRQGREFPQFLPAPRGRPQQGARMVTVLPRGRPQTDREAATSSSTGHVPSSTKPPESSRVRRTPHGLRPTQRAKTPTRSELPETYELNTDNEDWDDVPMINPNEQDVPTGSC
ncbi:unnamed protein product [Symbiodinium sp. KB8]|nr:unnamed protein product [Symbiodinium sp. KB8]